MTKKIATAIASYGMSGKVFHGPSLKVNANFEVTKILERTKTNSVKLFPKATIVKNFEAILEDDTIELVIVNTPDRLHYKMTKQALEAGKHVVVEKPFTHLASEAEELIKLAKSKNLILSVYQNRRWDNDFLTAQKIIQNKMVGRIVEFESHFDRYRTFIAPDTWKEEGDDYIGVLYNLGPHMVDQTLVLFGMPVSVTAHQQIVRIGGKVKDYFDIRLQYKSFAALLKCSYLAKEAGPRFSIHGNDGSFQKWGLDPQEALLKAGVLPVGDDWGKEPESEWGTLNTNLNGVPINGQVETIPGNYSLFYDNIYEAIRNGVELAVKAEEALNVIKILETCLESDKLKKTVFL